MKHFILLSKKKLLLSFCFFIFLNSLSTSSFAQSYNQVAGVYQAYQYGEPLIIEDMNMYYILNKNGIVLMAFGSSSGRAFSDVSNGISSGRIMTGDFTFSGDEITMKMNKGTGSTYWTYSSYNKTLTNGNMSLKYIDSL